MPLLLDTHAFLWFIDDDPRLSRRATQRISNSGARVLVSVASLWEIVIKVRTGKLALDRSPADLWQESLTINSFVQLPVFAEHVLAVSPLPLHHRDPFDRLLIAQAIVEGLQVVSSDVAFDSYTIERIW